MLCYLCLVIYLLLFNSESDIAILQVSSPHPQVRQPKLVQARYLIFFINAIRADLCSSAQKLIVNFNSVQILLSILTACRVYCVFLPLPWTSRCNITESVRLFSISQVLCKPEQKQFILMCTRFLHSPLLKTKRAALTSCSFVQNLAEPGSGADADPEYEQMLPVGRKLHRGEIPFS